MVEAHDSNDPWCLQDGKPILGIELTKKVTGKQRSLDILDSIRPMSSGLMERQKQFITLTSEMVCNQVLAPRPHL
jgi:hypothetical protein